MMYFLAVVLQVTARETTILFCHDQVDLNNWFEQLRILGTGALASDDIRAVLRRGGNAPRGSELVNLQPFSWAGSLVGKLCLIQIADDFPRPNSKIIHVIDLYEKYGAH